jgi:uncharacterized membrane protein YphA (DoxX/SURF4 family)
MTPTPPPNPAGVRRAAPKPSPEPRPAAEKPPPGETVGLAPWYPWPLSRWGWWTRPVRAERLAALRIGLAAMLLLDVLTTYLPNTTNFFGKGSLGEPPLFRYLWSETRWNWSLLYDVQSHTVLYLAMAAWIVALVGLLTGCFTRTCAVAVWVLSTSFANINENIDNAGDTVRGILLFYLAVSPCGATWSLDAWRSRRRPPVFIHPWPLRLILLQMVVIYWANGLHKVVGADWQRGNSLYYVLGDATLSRWSKAQFNIPYPLTRLMTWSVLGWEVSLPALLLSGVILKTSAWHGWQAALPDAKTSRWAARAARTFRALYHVGAWLPVVTLAFGALFHVGIWVTMELGFFPQYMLCLYLPLLPWERWADRRLKASPEPPPSGS